MFFFDKKPTFSPRHPHLVRLVTRNKKICGVVACLMLFLLACGGLPTSLASPTPTPTPPVEIEIVVKSAFTSVVPTPPPALSQASPTFTATATPSPPPTPSPTATVTPSPTLLPPTPAPPTPPPSPQADTAPPPETPPLQGSISLLSPENNVVLVSNINELEFKWQWDGDIRLKRCNNPIAGYGFEVRIWPAREGFGPLGTMDAAKNMEDPFFSCEPESGIRAYLVKHLHDKPGVKAGGAGKFLWDVALVQLNPYQPVITSGPHILEISFDYNGPLDPFGEKLNCSNFTAWAEAQAVFITAGGPGSDPHSLDPDGDGQACNELLGQ